MTGAAPTGWWGWEKERPAPSQRAGAAPVQAGPGWHVTDQRLQPGCVAHARASEQQADPAGRSEPGRRVSWDSAVAFSQELQRSLSAPMLPQSSSLSPRAPRLAHLEGRSVPYRLLAGRDLAGICALLKGRSRQLSVYSGRL